MMVTEKEIRVRVARCFEAMARYHDGGRSRSAMNAEVEAHAVWFAEHGLGADEALAKVLRPIEAYLWALYGCEVGSGLFEDFSRAFDDCASFTRMSDEPRPSCPLGASG